MAGLVFIHWIHSHRGQPRESTRYPFMHCFIQSKIPGQTKLATPPEELELAKGTVVNGTGDVDESGGGAVNKIEYVEWRNYMIKSIACVTFFFEGGGGMWLFHSCIDIMILLPWVNISMSALHTHRGHPVASVWYPVLQSSVQKKFARQAFPRGGASVVVETPFTVVLEGVVCDVTVTVWLTGAAVVVDVMFSVTPLSLS